MSAAERALDPEARSKLVRELNVIAVVAIVDFALLVPLVIASLGDNDNLVHVLGPIHGIGFLILLGLCSRGAFGKRWGWWFPALVVVTGGPIGSLVGDYLVRRGLRQTN